MADQDKYILDSEWIANAITTSKEIDTLINNAFTSSSALYSELKSTDLWQGEAKDAWHAFYHLVLQYHGLLIDGEVENASGNGKSDYTQRATDTLNTWQKAMADFCGNSTSFQEIEAIS